MSRCRESRPAVRRAAASCRRRARSASRECGRWPAPRRDPAPRRAPPDPAPTTRCSRADSCSTPAPTSTLPLGSLGRTRASACHVPTSSQANAPLTTATASLRSSRPTSIEIGGDRRGRSRATSPASSLGRAGATSGVWRARPRPAGARRSRRRARCSTARPPPSGPVPWPRPASRRTAPRCGRRRRAAHRARCSRSRSPGATAPRRP